VSLASQIEFLRRLKTSRLADGLGARAPGDSPLVETTSFGANPGALRMWSYLPPKLPAKAALVVVLHGCGQTAAGYEFGAGWSTLARRYGFALLMPEQHKANNPQGCFNWFSPEDVRRGHGEVASIRAMIEQMICAHRIDRKRVYVTGLSAGGAMSAALLATYPDVFAAGAVIAGLPYGVAHNVRQALHAMMSPATHSGPELGDRVRHASRHQGPWPKLSVWHGSADRTVHPGNASQLVLQWLDLHGVPAKPSVEAMVDGHARRQWLNSAGDAVVESFTIAGMAHGTPLGVADTGERFGAPGPFLLEAGIASSYHIAKFFGLTGRIHLAAAAEAAPKLDQASTAAQSAPNDQFAQPGAAARRGIDVGAVITKALTAAGLIK
jgi:feruloyl esterase